MSSEELKKIAHEHRELEHAILANFRVWSLCENVLSVLVQRVLRLEGPMGSFGSVVYFSATSLGARLAMVDNLVTHMLEACVWTDKSIGERATKVWASTYKLLDDSIWERNIIAHGSIHPIFAQGKNHVRITSPMFDVLRFSGKLVKGKIPGLGLEGLQKANRRLLKAHDAIHMFMAFLAFIPLGDAQPLYTPATWQEKLAQLEAHLQKNGNRS
jgi:hypothetical protein